MRYFVTVEGSLSPINLTNKELFQLLFGGSLQFVVFSVKVEDILVRLLDSPNTLFKYPGNWRGNDANFGMLHSYYNCEETNNLLSLADYKHSVVSSIDHILYGNKAEMHFKIASGYSSELATILRKNSIDEILKEL